MCLLQQSLSDLALSYVADCVYLVADLAVTFSSECSVILHAHSTFGDKNFAAVSPQLWNNIPSYLRWDIGCWQVRRKLRTFVFGS